MTSTALKRRLRTVLLGLGCALFVYLVVHLGAAQITRLLLEIGWYFVLVAAIYVGYQMVRTFAYWKCVAVSGHCSYWDLLRLRLSGEAIQFLTATGPFLAEPAKMWLLRRQGLTAKRAVAATVSEYLLYTFTSAAFAVAGLTYLLQHFQLSGAMGISAKALVFAMGTFLAAAACAIVFRIYLIGAILTWFRRLPMIGKHLPFEDRDIRDTEDLLFIVLRDRPVRLLSILAVEFAAQALLVLELFVLLQAMGETSSFQKPFLIEGATKFIGLAFFFIPGQMGAAEGTYALIFKTVGLSASSGFALAVARRLRSVLVAGAGLAFAPLWRDTPGHEPG